MRYAWDRRKAESHEQKHRVRFEEAVTVFEDPVVVFVEDFDHGDDRYVALGLSEQHRVLFVVRVELSDSETRLISARRASAHESRRYEEDD